MTMAEGVCSACDGPTVYVSGVCGRFQQEAAEPAGPSERRAEAIARAEAERHDVYGYGLQLGSPAEMDGEGW